MTPYYETPLGKLYHGDCLEIMPQLELDDMALMTDPLYGDNVQLQRARQNKTEKKRILKGLELIRYDWPEMKGNDKPLDPEPFINFGQSIIWGGNYISDKLPPSRKWIIWDKLHIPPDNHNDCEMAWTNLPGVTRIHRQLWRGICREGSENITNGRKLHPFQKPLRLIMFCINQFEGNTAIFDPFLGSGTAAVACEIFNRKWIGIEIEEKYCEIAARRIELERKQRKLF